VILDNFNPILNAEEIAEYQHTIKQIIVENNLLLYIAAIVDNTRSNADLFLVACPRASQSIINDSKALSSMRGRECVTPNDIKKIESSVLRHRIILTTEREMEGITADKVVQKIMETIEIPR